MIFATDWWLLVRAQTSLHLHSDGIKCYCGVNNEGANSLIHLTRQTIEDTLFPAIFSQELRTIKTV